MKFAILSPILSQLRLTDKDQMYFYGEWGTNLVDNPRHVFVSKNNLLTTAEFNQISENIQRLIYYTSQYLTKVHPNTSIPYWEYQLSNIVEQIYSICHQQIEYFNLATENEHIPLVPKIYSDDYISNIPTYKLAFAKDFRLHAYAAAVIIKTYGNLSKQTTK